MMKEDDLMLFWKFLYGIENLPIPNKGDKHFSIAGNMLGASVSSDSSWKLSELEVKDPLKKNRNIKGFIKFTTGNDTLEKHIRQGNLSISTINSILCYFFFYLIRSHNDINERVAPLNDLKGFFDIIDVKTIAPEHVFYTSSLIRHLLIKVQLIETYHELQPDFKLSFFRYTNEAEYVELFTGIKDVTNQKTESLSLKNIINYKEQLRNEFKEIRLGFEGFPIPIDQIIELPFFRIDKRREEQRDLLKNELKLLKKEQEGYEEHHIQVKQGSILMRQFTDEIQKITVFLNRKNKPLEVLNKQENVFILSPAGSGKTTTLKWFAYKLSYQNNQLPIFIELQSYKSDLISLIKHSLKLYKLDFETIRNHKYMILLIDGFDEYSGGDQNILLREIRDFKREFNCQIIFSGRYKPVGLGEKEFYTYRLSEFDENDILRIFNYVFPDKGEQYYIALNKAALLESISVPLFLMFLIAHIKKQGQFNLKKVTALLENKGKLLKTVLIDDFLNEYEQKKELKLQEYQWLRLKTKQIELISLFGYYLTFELKNKENAHREDDAVIEYLKTNAKPAIRYKNIDHEQLLIDFKEHSILSFKRDFVGFDKKEVRLFFAAYYLKNQIENIEDYEKYKNDFKGDVDSWNSIETYLIGLIEPNKIMKEINSFFVGEQIIYSRAFITQLEFALKFIKSGNTDVKYKLLNKFYFLNIIGLILYNDLKFVKNNKSKELSIIYGSFFHLTKIGKHPIRKQFSSLIPHSNHSYLHSIYIKRIFPLCNTYRMAEILDKHKNRNIFKDIEVHPNSFRKRDYSFNKTPISISDLGNTPNLLFFILNNIIFDDAFHQKSIEKKNSTVLVSLKPKRPYQPELKHITLYLESFFKLYASAYLDFYLKTNTPTIFNLKTLYLYFKKHSIKISSDKILPETREKIINHFNEVAYHSKNKYSLVIIIYSAFKALLDSEIKNELLQSWRNKISKNNTSEKVKNILVEVLFRHLQDEDIPLFLSLLQSENSNIKHNAIFGLSLYTARASDNSKEFIVEIFDTLHDLFNNTDDDFKGSILSAFQLYRVVPPEYFIRDILKFADNGKTHYYSAIMFFGQSQIQQAEPYLIRALNEQNSPTFEVFEALVRLNDENFYKYDSIKFEAIRAIINVILTNLQNDENQLKIDNETLDNCVKIGDEDTLKTLEETYTILFNKSTLTYSEKKEFIKAIDILKLKVARLQRTNYYLTYILPQKKPSDDKSEGSILY